MTQAIAGPTEADQHRQTPFTCRADHRLITRGGWKIRKLKNGFTHGFRPPNLPRARRGPTPIPPNVCCPKIPTGPRRSGVRQSAGACETWPVTLRGTIRARCGCWTSATGDCCGWRPRCRWRPRFWTSSASCLSAWRNPLWPWSQAAPTVLRHNTGLGCRPGRSHRRGAAGSVRRRGRGVPACQSIVSPLFLARVFRFLARRGHGVRPADHGIALSPAELHPAEIHSGDRACTDPGTEQRNRSGARADGCWALRAGTARCVGRTASADQSRGCARAIAYFAALTWGLQRLLESVPTNSALKAPTSTTCSACGRFRRLSARTGKSPSRTGAPSTSASYGNSATGPPRPRWAHRVVGMLPAYVSEAALVVGAMALAAVLFSTQPTAVAAGHLCGVPRHRDSPGAGAAAAPERRHVDPSRSRPGRADLFPSPPISNVRRIDPKDRTPTRTRAARR